MNRLIPALAGLLVALVAGLVSVSAQPATDAVDRGRLLFDQAAGGVGCASCHARYALGALGPAIRGFGAGEIQDALTLVPDMGFLSLSPAEIDDIAAYLAFLGSLRPFKVTIRDGAFAPASLAIPAGATVQLIFENADASPYGLATDGQEQKTLLGRGMNDFVWAAPVETGTFDIVLLGSMNETLATLVVTAE
jgi:mono/diheme cytochrome c family protein